MTSPLILLVEDNPGDVGLWCEAWEAAGIEKNQILVAEDGLKALEILGRQVELQALPKLIISDSRLPGMDGATLGTHIRQQSQLNDVPFIIVSGIVPTMAEHPNVLWFEKPHDFDHLCTLAEKLHLDFLQKSQSKQDPPPTLT
jgi:CheY-like chemotaxis protein